MADISRLLSANFARLKKDKVFWVSMALMFGFGAFLVINMYREHLQYGGQMAPVLDNVFFVFATVIGILCAAFCSLFLGTEYSDGTIRNKLVVGHTRGAIYFSNLITSVVAALFMCAAFLISVSAFGIPLIGFLQTDLKLVFLVLLGCVVMTIAFCSLCTMLSMINQNKAVVATISIIGIFVLLFAATFIYSRLNVPEFYNGYSVGDASVESMPNPQYLRGTERAVYKFLLDFLPTGQGLQYTSMAANHLWQMPLYSSIITIVTTGIGVLVFRRKDIK